tara:strand:+ start:3536 stop:3652 length:117 start_codon:yes stop_codon:yes gene_type:complete
VWLSVVSALRVDGEYFVSSDIFSQYVVSIVARTPIRAA